LDPAQKHEREEIGLTLRDEVEKKPLLLEAHGLGLIDRGDPQYPKIGRIQPIERRLQHELAVAKVRTEG